MTKHMGRALRMFVLLAVAVGISHLIVNVLFGLNVTWGLIAIAAFLGVYFEVYENKPDSKAV